MTSVKLLTQRNHGPARLPQARAGYSFAANWLSQR